MLGRRNYRNPVSPGQSPELVSSVIIPVIVFCMMFLADYIFRSSTDRSLRFITLLDYTANSSDGVVIIPQDPSNEKAIQIAPSVNERTGVEFAYSFFIKVKESNFTGVDTLRHVFHKGYRLAWPLLGPGVFISGMDNTMKVIMNTNTNVFMHADVTNIPINKWFHVVLNSYKSGLDIYINGNLAHRIPFTNGIIYQNFQDLILFSPNNTSVSSSVTHAAGDSNINFAGSFDGQLSSMKYARYALSLKEIKSLMTEGPSSAAKVNVDIKDTTYLSETWWANQ
jgi:hypothetical protein